ncbi:juvenile hormone esterase-like isoform X1 [Onthophagus taurus]|uniref:juvenile hormone esterase-like isoform X1 n=2 Tax=Onthophagus taurus TaxID=166361 RepID=UPI0039BE3775
MYKMYCVIFSAFIIVSTSRYTFNEKRNVVKISSGLLNGKLMRTYNQRIEYLAFLKVPFAKAPIGNLRFKPPQFIDNWKGIYDSTKEGDACLQMGKNDTLIGSEDCLYMRVYTPKRRKNNELLPVMYYVHGGGFKEGSPNFKEYGPDIFMEKSVVLALVQYRLSVYGFLSTEDLNCPGNNGNKDQRLGLKWIKQNAKAFGGDPERITIFGHSAGSASIGILVNTPTTKGDYRAAIQQSASDIASFLQQVNARKRALKIGEEFGIITNNTKELIEKLQKIDSKELYKKALDIGNKVPTAKGSLVFTTIIESDHPDAIITRKPLQQLEKDEYNRVPIMLGFTSLEALTLMDFVDQIASKVKTDSTVLIPNTLYPKDNATELKLGETIKQYYYKGNDFNYSTLRYTSDNVIVRPVLKKAHLISRYTPTYFYKFSYIGYLGDPLNPNRRGVGHAEELNYLYRNSNEPKNIPEGDAKIREQLVTMWTNFATTLNPTPKEINLLDNIIWPQYKKETQYKALSIDTKLTIKEKINETDYLFWEKMFSYDTKHVGYF